MQNKTNIVLYGQFSHCGGYGQYSRALAYILIDLYKNNENINLIFVDPSLEFVLQDQRYDLYNSRYREILKYMRQLSIIDTEIIEIFICVSTPMTFIAKGIYNIGVTALFEADKIHPNLVNYLNLVDEVWVMSQYNIDCIKNSSYSTQDGKSIVCNKPVNKFIHPFLYDLNNIVYNETDITQYLDNIQPEFLFLNVGQWLPGLMGNDRKDIGALISVFAQTFRDNNNVGFVIKTSLGRSTILSQYSIRQRVSEIMSMLRYPEDKLNIYFISGQLDDSQMIELYKHNKIKAYLNFSHAQSFGIPMFQFSGLTGKPLITPYHSGMLEYVKPEYCEILVHKQQELSSELFQYFYKDFTIPGAKWYTIDYNYALHKLQQFVKNYNMWIENGIEQQKYIVENFNKEVIKLDVAKLLMPHLENNNDLEQ